MLILLSFVVKKLNSSVNKRCFSSICLRHFPFFAHFNIVILFFVLDLTRDEAMDLLKMCIEEVSSSFT